MLSGGQTVERMGSEEGAGDAAERAPELRCALDPLRMRPASAVTATQRDAAAQPSPWPLGPPADLRKQARQLENELDLKLVSFSKLCTSYSHTNCREGRRDSSDTTPLLNGSSQDRMFETMAVEIEQLLGKLTGINDKMAEYTNSAGVPSLNAALMHTLQRHRDILQDYTHEFHKTKSNFIAVRERENLMGSVRKDIESYKSGCGVNNRRTELFLKEHEHLRNSDRLIEETIRLPLCVVPTLVDSFFASRDTHPRPHPHLRFSCQERQAALRLGAPSRLPLILRRPTPRSVGDILSGSPPVGLP
ncbi:Golgi SNAP receptor complex member 1 isoform X2 [Pogona vitticeps]